MISLTGHRLFNGGALPLLVAALAVLCPGRVFNPRLDAAMTSQDPQEEVDKRLEFLLIQLANTETTLEAIEEQLTAAVNSTKKKVGDAKRADLANEKLDRKGGGPVRWQEYYGRLRGQPRLPQFDYIYRANESTKARALADALQFAGRVEALRERRAELEKEQAALWCQIAFRLIDREDYLNRPLYLYEFKAPTEEVEVAKHRVLREAVQLFRTAVSLPEKALVNQDSAFGSLHQGVKASRQKLVDASNSTERTWDDKSRDLIRRLLDKTKELEELSANLSDSFQIAREGEASGDESRKEMFRTLLQDSIMSYAQTTIEIDRMIDTIAVGVGPTPDYDRKFGNPGSARMGAAEPPLQVAGGLKPLQSPFGVDVALQAQSEWASSLGIDVKTVNSIGMEMVVLPPGSYVMGSPSDERERGKNEDSHAVRITKPFLVSATEVSKDQYALFIKSTGHTPQHEKSNQGIWGYAKDSNGVPRWGQHKSLSWASPGFEQGPDHPVVGVSWFDAVEFCNWLSVKEGLPPFYAVSGRRVTIMGGSGYRLPFEAEWEYACRAGTTGIRSFGELSLGDNANTADEFLFRTLGYGAPATGRVENDGFSETSPARSFLPNNFGLYDMHGNVWEWCWDFYGPYDSKLADDPQGPSEGVDRIARGGGWNGYEKDSRSADRGAGYDPKTASVGLGIRVVRSVE